MTSRSFIGLITHVIQSTEEHRDYLRFLWYEENNMGKNVIDYRMKFHIFGNSPSPAVAIYCMRNGTLVSRIRKSTHPDQWFYISTEKNPADHATRLAPANLLQHTSWLSGPPFLSQVQAEEILDKQDFALINPEADDEIRPDVVTLLTKTSQKQLSCHRFMHFPSWKSLIHTLARLNHVTVSFQKVNTGHKGWQQYRDPCSVTELLKAKNLVIGSVQREVFKEEYNCIEKGQPISKQSPLKSLNPVVDENGLLRIGGRISLYADVCMKEKHPLILPRTHHISTLLVRFYHEQVQHQGRHITEGAIRAVGFWIVGSKRAVSTVIHKCVTCRKLRGQAVHIQLIESMTTSSFINALRRFFSIRGPAKLLRSDRGTNFVGACKELRIDTDDPSLQNYLQEKGYTIIVAVVNKRTDNQSRCVRRPFKIDDSRMEQC
ncbi:Protocadherin-like wing polarity protein stan [Labeo rohita]|uniref:Protocadherin-like wing polarity protein stan n=1 Tax=Labeo rohita TaxID=84645 RepID=A0ABQ8LEL4_LABRO|nr:Protocadherin-like wing polarity protein stan [Labeo rohita]